MSAIGFWAIAAAIGISYIVSAVKAACERRVPRRETPLNEAARPLTSHAGAASLSGAAEAGPLLPGRGRAAAAHTRKEARNR